MTDIIEGEIIASEKALAAVPQQALAIMESSNPAQVLLASKPSPHSRRTMRRALDTIAEMLTNGTHRTHDIFSGKNHAEEIFHK